MSTSTSIPKWRMSRQSIRAAVSGGGDDTQNPTFVQPKENELRHPSAWPLLTSAGPLGAGKEGRAGRGKETKKGMKGRRKEGKQVK